MLVKDYAEQWLAGRDVRPTTQARDVSLFRTHISLLGETHQLELSELLKSPLGVKSYKCRRLQRARS
jgi:hypothetical protein